ncbi:MAG: glycoside hydrolase family 127 protein [Prevotella sp.]|nr:glycoside hydrolase family 127 protein [Prevotella sp.]
MKRNFPIAIAVSAMVLAMASKATAQSELYPKHFDLEQVELLDGPMKTAMNLNIKMLLQYDTDRLLTPFVRQAGLASTTDSSSPYYQWLTKHPNFKNWGGDAGFDLSGHVGGHYLSALALAYAACHDENVRAQLKERMDYMLNVMKDCQDAYDQNTEGLYGFIGGQPINDSWKKLYQGDLSGIQGNWGWVPFYVQHKILAGLRDAYLYGNSDVAKELFRKLADWSVNVVAKVSSNDFEGFLNCEHGGMNESMLDAYQLFGDAKYLTAAKKYTHKAMLNGMQTLNTTFLDGKHANTQVPKFIGMERIYEQSSTLGSYKKAAENFWQDVAMNRTVCIGGNSVGEHFLSVANSNRYIDQLDGPESCNSNNMLKMSEMLADRTGDAKYVDFYESTMWNHILSTQDPKTGGYVYFTTLRPQGYRIYSQPNQGMWCCVGTGMENHSKYGHFIYTHDGSETLYVNLFTPSKLVSDDFVITQDTNFPNSNTTELTIGKAGHYTIAIRHPEWAGNNFEWSVNGEKIGHIVEQGKASYVKETRDWKVGDKISVTLDMQLRYKVCPNYTDYIAFKYGPILLGAATTALADGDGSGLPYEKLQNEYGGEGRMDHAPGSRATSKSLVDAPMLIGDRADVLSRIQRLRSIDLSFTIDASRPEVSSYKWSSLKLVPFYKIHHQRYMCYWYQQTAENYANSSMAQTEAANEALAQRTLDFVAPGEQQSEAGHDVKYSSDSSTGMYNSERYRDARANGYIQYTLYNNTGVDENLSVLFRFNLADRGRMATLTIDGQKVADITIPSSYKGSDSNGFYNVEYAIPAALTKGKTKFVVRLTASSSTLCPGVYYVRLMKDYNAEANAYQFRCTDWTTGDPNRVQASKFTYDEDNNTITVNAGTGANNVALMMKYEGLDYDISKEQIYLIVRGTNLKTTSGASYLWWLNGTNRGSQVPPVSAQTVTIDGMQQQVIAFNMETSGLYDNFTQERNSVCMGQTIFGLTSTTGTSTIYDINFVASADDYVIFTTGIEDIGQPLNYNSQSTNYNLGGRPVVGAGQLPARNGIRITNRKKILN